ncbi:TNT domain-containing protein [Mycolicibacterium bacteremicum]|uniref:TNT domain-containing protein n=1 Tax=Mycolicibacterium bacteremicum TaxID=564198 RepID=A0A1W9YNB0_MYCBA|nr:TNT domain-containing protein [Mycolicibacterium bacteremicum]MCV7430162.1 glycohydrolase toxin TNT-related protein [Mycolicibacterium bacteremicum]ORA01534.1 hypothetical protein BST17_27920 [Mycolicibacterium bacteremicum]
MRIEVEPQALIDAGKNVGSLGDQLEALSDALGQALAGGIASGGDPAGLNFGIGYSRQADEFGKYLAQAADAFKNVGLMLEATGINYQHADQASVAGGAGPTGSVSGQPAKTAVADAPYGPNGSLVTPPMKYHLITPFIRLIPGFGMAAGVAMTWPSGNSGMMNVTAAQWRNIARGLKVFEPALNTAKTIVGAQNIPEGGDITTALSDLGSGATTLAGVADGIATSVSDFAGGVQETQDAIRDLLDRISLDGLWDTVTGLLSGDGDKVLREIADDVSTVLENFQNQVQGVLGLLDELGTLLGEASDALNKWIRPILVDTFGEGAGNSVANLLDLYTDIQVGGAVAVIGLVSGTVALADPDTWKGLADTAIMIAKDPTKIDDVLKQAGSDFIALDEWQGENPGRGFGEAVGNIATLFIPGGAFAKGGAVAKGLAATRNLLEKGEIGRLGRLPGLGDRGTPDLPGLPDGPGAPHVPEFSPSPGVPPSVLNPPGSGSPGSSGSSGSAGSSGSPNGSPPVRPQGGDPGSPSSPGGGSGNQNTPSPNGSGGNPNGAGPGSPSSGGPAPTGGSPSPGGGDGPSSNGPVPTGGSPGTGGGDGPTGGTQSSPSVSSPADSPGSAGPSKSASDDGPGPVTGGGGSNEGGGDGPGGGSSGGGDGSGDSSSGGSEGGADDGMSHEPDGSDTPNDHGVHHDGNDPGVDVEDKDPPQPIPAAERFPDAAPYGDLTQEQFEQQFVDDAGELRYPDENDPSKPYAIPGTIRELTPDDIRKLDGTVLDRIGHPGGKWLAPEGADYGERALPPSSLEKDYYRYRVNADNPLPPGWTIEESRVAPWFGHPGGGLQYKIVAPSGERPNILELLEPPGFLEPI